MSSGEMAFLGLVIFAFLTFIVSVGFVSVWSRKPRPTPEATQHKAVTVDLSERLKAA